MSKEKKRIINIGIVFVLGIFLTSFLSASFCCEKLDTGPWCQSAENEADCDALFESVATSCESTSYCRLGTCIDSNNGICMPNTAYRTCDTQGGTWDQRSESEIPQCQLGCCIIGQRTAFTTNVDCENQASDEGQESDFRAEITDEMTCIAMANPIEKGACVFVNDKNQRDCRMETREVCQARDETIVPSSTEEPNLWERIFGGGAQQSETPALSEIGISFYPGYLCSAQELNTICGPRGGTACDDDGKVYFQDTCDNFANVYDSEKLNDDNDYWTYIREPDCSPENNPGNKQSADCGDCDYLAGSTCKQKKVGETVDYGNFICRSLDCLDYTNADEGFETTHPKHGEKWCASSPGVGLIEATRDETGTTFTGGDDTATNNLPGSEYYTKKCYNGEISVEKCGTGYRPEVCVQSDEDERESETFWSAVCKKTLSIDCFSQNTSEDCNDIDERDCKWMETGYYFSANRLKSKTETNEIRDNPLIPSGICVPRYAPGFDIYSDKIEENGAGVCPLASSICLVTYEVGIGKTKMLRNISALTLEQKKSICVKNCHCLPRTEAEITAGDVEWQTTMNSMCVALGDCGNKNNLIGRQGEQTQVVFVEAAPGEETTE